MVNKSKVQDWIEYARDYAVALADATDEPVSVNDLFEAIVRHELPAPPSDAGLVKRGHALCMVFDGVEYFEDTGQMVPGVNPASKRRKVKTWRLCRDRLPICMENTRKFMEDSSSW